VGLPRLAGDRYAQLYSQETAAMWRLAIGRTTVAICLNIGNVRLCYFTHAFYQGSAGLSSRVVSASDCGVERIQVRITPLTVVFIATAAAIYSLEHGLCTFTAVLRST